MMVIMMISMMRVGDLERSWMMMYDDGCMMGDGYDNDNDDDDYG